MTLESKLGELDVLLSGYSLGPEGVLESGTVNRLLNDGFALRHKNSLVWVRPDGHNRYSATYEFLDLRYSDPNLGAWRLPPTALLQTFLVGTYVETSGDLQLLLRSGAVLQWTGQDPAWALFDYTQADRLTLVEVGDAARRWVVTEAKLMLLGTPKVVGFLTDHERAMRKIPNLGVYR